ncbi:MAG TPA: condensation domain-containing protein, partial [Nitrospiraceae bacterium]|nr:condensation domain-containing protein [Nitrospiraceae bacterium]
MEPGNSFYNIPAAVRLRGVLDVEALERTLDEVVRRHEALRTTFVAVDGKPRQVIKPYMPVGLPVFDVSEMDAAEREAETRRLLSEEASQPFDLARGPLVRACLVRLQADEHVALVTMHHIISDGWSTGIFIREVAALYGAYVRGEESPLEELPIQYADFAHWQRGWLQGEVLAAQLEYWREALADAPTMLELATDRPRPREQTFNGAAVTLVLEEELTGQLKELSQRERVTLFMTLLAGFQCLLFRHSGQDDIVVGTPIANRRYRELEDLIGFFVNTLALRASSLATVTFSELLQRVREVTLGAYAHQDLPFEKLVEELQPERDLSRNPLFQVMFALQNAPKNVLELPGLRLEGEGGESRTTRFDLECHVWEEGQVLRGAFVYNTNLFEQPTIERLVVNYQTLLQSIVADPTEAVTSLRLLRVEDERQLLYGWNETATEYAAGMVHELFAAQAAQHPKAVAIVFENRQLTYEELNRRANQLAHHLQALEVGPEVVVGICVERSMELVVALLGVLKAGAAYLPLDPSYPAERLSFMLTDAGVRFIISHQAVEAMLPALLPDSTIKVLSLDVEWATVATQPATAPGVQVSPKNLAYILYTSGSTGQPKGVMISHGAISNHMQWMAEQLSLGASDAVLQQASFGFDASVWEFYVPLLAGARLVMARPGGQQDLSYLLEVMEREGVTHLQAVPTLLRMLV